LTFFIVHYLGGYFFSGHSVVLQCVRLYRPC